MPLPDVQEPPLEARRSMKLDSETRFNVAKDGKSVGVRPVPFTNASRKKFY
jgi:hypothetical protein